MPTGAEDAEGTTDADPISRVTTLELFFDLAFVFTITQLTSVLAGNLGAESLWHVAVMLALIFYMYDGYAWLTNAVPARGAGRHALALSGGVSIFMLGDVAFRHLLLLGRTRWRWIAAGAVLAAVPLGTEVSAALGLAATGALLAGCLALEGWAGRKGVGAVDP